MGSVEVVDTLTWRQVDFGGVVLAGITGGYLMALVGLWAGRVRYLVAIDIADYGRRARLAGGITGQILHQRTQRPSATTAHRGGQTR